MTPTKQIVYRDFGHFKVDGIYCRLIPLTQGQWAIVWESDFDWLDQWKWCAMYSKKMGSFYAVRGENGHLVLLHRQILGLNRGDKTEGDHVDPLRTTENTRTNLRLATRLEQCRNTRPRPGSKSGYKGVTYVPSRKKWQAQIGVDRVNHFLGRFNTALEAYAAYCAAAKHYFGKFARVA